MEMNWNMKKYCALIVFLVLAWATAQAPAQANSYPWPSSGSVGIGTTNPAKELDVRGGQALIGNGSGDWGYNYGLQVKNAGSTETSLSIWQEGVAAAQLGFYPSNSTFIISNGASTNGDFNNAALLSLTSNGNVGIGLTNPQAELQLGTVASGTAEATYRGLIQIQGASDVNSASSGPNGLEFKASAYGSGFGWKILSPDRGNGNTPLSFAYRANASAWTELMTMRTDNGNVGIGTTSPQAKLEINGDLRFTADGSVQKTAWTGVLCGGDYAEAMNAAGGKAKYESGDVLVLASQDNSDVQKSSEPYSTMVAGIVATKPGVVGLRAAIAKLTENVPMAMVGVVPTKVSAENGPIHRGDLLVTASLAGYAMKGTDRGRLVGAVIGKAMGSLDSGTGVIEVLVTLQ